MQSTVLMLLFLIAGVHAHSGCRHDAVARTTGGLRNRGFSYNREVPYASAAGGRRLVNVNYLSTARRPLRIALDYSAGAISGGSMTAEKQSFLRDTLLPAALSWRVPRRRANAHENWRCGSSIE